MSNSNSSPPTSWHGWQAGAETLPFAGAQKQKPFGAFPLCALVIVPERDRHRDQKIHRGWKPTIVSIWSNSTASRIHELSRRSNESTWILRGRQRHRQAPCDTATPEEECDAIPDPLADWSPPTPGTCHDDHRRGRDFWRNARIGIRAIRSLAAERAFEYTLEVIDPANPIDTGSRSKQPFKTMNRFRSALSGEIADIYLQTAYR